MIPRTGLNVVTILGSVREGRQCDRVAKYVVQKLKEAHHEVIILDPKELNYPILNKAHHHYPEGTAPEYLERVHQILVRADAFVVISAEYNHSIPAALSNLMSHFSGRSYAKRPSAIVTYSMGPYGGVRAAMQLRAFLAELLTPSIPSLFPIAIVQNALDDEGKAKDESLDSKIKPFINDLEWYAKAMRAQRTADVIK